MVQMLNQLSKQSSHIGMGEIASSNSLHDIGAIVDITLCISKLVKYIWVHGVSYGSLAKYDPVWILHYMTTSLQFLKTPVLHILEYKSLLVTFNVLQGKEPGYLQDLFLLLASTYLHSNENYTLVDKCLNLHGIVTRHFPFLQCVLQAL